MLSFSTITEVSQLIEIIEMIKYLDVRGMLYITNPCQRHEFLCKTSITFAITYRKREKTSIPFLCLLIPR